MGTIGWIVRATAVSGPNPSVHTISEETTQAKRHRREYLPAFKRE